MDQSPSLEGNIHLISLGNSSLLRDPRV